MQFIGIKILKLQIIRKIKEKTKEDFIIMLSKKNKGITLVALVITIIILLILAGISISALTNTGIFAKAKDAQSKSALADAKEKMTLLLNEWQMDHVTSTKTLETFLQEKVTDKTIEEYEKLDNGNYEVYINGYVGVIDGEGNIVEEMQKAGPRPTISNITIKSEDGTTDVADNSQKAGTKLQINFSSSIENGTIKSVTPAVPYTTNGTETEVTFTVVGTVDGTDYTIKKTVNVARKYKQFEKLTLDKLNTSFTENKTFQDPKGNIITVPTGFKIVSTNDTNSNTNAVPTVDQGIVIEDATSGATAGSQFVWIPVGTITKADGTTVNIKLNRYTFNYSTGTERAYSGSDVEEDANDPSTLKNIEGKSIAKNITNFKNSVKENGGYYIGRYEARTTTPRNDKGNDLTQITEKGTDQVYNYVTQQQAAEQAQGMYTSNNFTSDLMNSYAWDTATLFLQNCGTNKKYSIKNSLNTLLSQTGTNALTEINKIDKQCNVYDMASNVFEWTTETSSESSYPCVDRGGSYSPSGLYVGEYYVNFTCGRYDDSTSDGFRSIGFRPLLYVNV